MKKLVFGDAAPTFEVHDIYDQKVTLTPNATHATLIVFLRFSTCPFCNMAIHRLITEYQKLQDNGVHVIAFVLSSKEKILQHIVEARDEKPQFPLIPAQRPNVYAMYDVRSSLNGAGTVVASIPLWVKKVLKHGFKSIDVDSSIFMAQALFLIAPSGKVALAKYVTNVFSPEVFAEVYETAARFPRT